MVQQLPFLSLFEKILQKQKLEVFTCWDTAVPCPAIYAFGKIISLRLITVATIFHAWYQLRHENCDRPPKISSSLTVFKIDWSLSESEVILDTKCNVERMTLIFPALKIVATFNGGDRCARNYQQGDRLHLLRHPRQPNPDRRHPQGHRNRHSRPQPRRCSTNRPSPQRQAILNASYYFTRCDRSSPTRQHPVKLEIQLHQFSPVWRTVL